MTTAPQEFPFSTSRDAVDVGCDALISPSFEPQIIDAPAKCIRCGITTVSPTTGKLINRCLCGGELKTNHEHI